MEFRAKWFGMERSCSRVILYPRLCSSWQWIPCNECSKSHSNRADRSLRSDALLPSIRRYLLSSNPSKEDVQAFSDLLHHFGQATGLCTNLQKSQVAPIRCDSLDLDGILDGTPAMRASFPMKYLGLLLTTTRLWRRDLQPLYDKINEPNCRVARKACGLTLIGNQEAG